MPVKRKGADGPAEWVVKRTATFLQDTGLKKVVVKSDQENPIKDLLRHVCQIWDGQAVPEHSPVGDSQANGLAEQSVKEVTGMLRTWKDHFESHMKQPLKADSDILAWMIEYSALCLNCFKVGQMVRPQTSAFAEKKDMESSGAFW